MKRRYLAVCLTLLFALALVRLVPALSRERPGPSPSTTPPPTPEAPLRVALLAGSGDPLCGALYRPLEQMAEQEGWELVTYDCNYSSIAQSVQLSDLIDSYDVDVAVLAPIWTGSPVDDWVALLREDGAAVITLGATPRWQTLPQIACHLDLNDTRRSQAAVRYLLAHAGEDDAVITLANTYDEPLEAALLISLEGAGLPVADRGYAWSSVPFATRYSASALEQHPNTAWILAFGNEGAQGAKAAAGPGVQVLMMRFNSHTLDALEACELDGALVPSPAQTLELLRDAIPRAARGERLGVLPLPLEMVTPDTVDRAALGYD